MSDNNKNEWTKGAIQDFWKQFLASNVRRALSIVGSALATHGWITTDQAGGLTTLAMVEFVVSIILVFGSTAWAWAKAKFNALQPRTARAAKESTPIGVITTDTLNKSTFISSL
jgi:hypothetical protein